MSATSTPHRIALVGNPNSGKTTLFNALTGENQKVGNYSGVTVSKKSGTFRTPHGRQIELIDLPGCYSLSPNSPDEEVTLNVLLGDMDGEDRPELVICVVDASALERHLNLVLQVIELKVPVVLALNMVDQAESDGIRLDPAALSEELDIPVVPMQANKKKGIIELKQSIRFPLPHVPDAPWVKSNEDATAEHRISKIKDICSISARRESDDSLSFTDKIDAYLLNPWFGWPTLIGTMLVVFFALFTLSEYPMGWVESGFGALETWVESFMQEGDLRDLITGGIIAGLGGTVVFLPQIIILFFFIGLMESTGYMSRAAYIMDGLMAKAGLSGRAFLPLLSSHACAIPGIMGARTINSAKERLITILIAPWMSCTARIPVYTTIIALLLPGHSVWIKACIMLGIYSVGIITSLIAARLLRTQLKEDEEENHFMLELPPYRKPQLSYLLRHIVDRGLSFLKRAGTVILGISIILWALQTYPKPAAGSEAADNSAIALEQSYMGQIGKGVEPIVEPLGYDWRTGTAVMASFAAREVFISNLAITYRAEDDDEQVQDRKLREKLAAATWPDGRKLYTPLTLISLLIFFIYALQCFPTTIVVMRETNSWKWAAAQLVGMSTFAYVAALIVYQTGRLLGYA